MELLDSVMAPLEWLVSWILVAFHSGLTALGLDTDSGASWGLSIVGLVIVIRIALIPLFVKQIKAQRGLQMLQPEIKKIQAKYKDDRQRQSEEMMKMYRETGTNPFSSCLPILAQAPVFFALFRVLQGIASGDARGVLTPELVESAREATIFGAPLYATFTTTDVTQVRIVTLILIALMTATTFLTQRQLLMKNMPADNPMAQQQKILLYVFPVMFAVFGINFPVGVLIYWLTTNLWTMGQQFYVIRNNPTPGTPAEKAHEERLAEKARWKASGANGVSRFVQRVVLRRRAPRPEGDVDPGPSVAGVGAGPAGPPKPPRNQPKRKPRSKR